MNDVGKTAPNGIGMSGVYRSRGSPRPIIGALESRKMTAPRPRGRRPTYWRGYAKVASMLLVVCAAAIIIASATAPAPETIPGDIARQPPPPPYYVVGYTRDAGGAIDGGCDVTVTNLRTGEFLTNTSLAANGFYQVDLNKMPSLYEVGDMIRVTAEKGLYIGSNESAVPGGPFLWMDVTLSTLIPEFPMVIVPVAGMLALVVATVGLRRRAQKS